jgi:hypothetical protein
MKEGRMYAKPTLRRFGTFRELTRLGWGADGDGGIWGFLDGCELGGCEGGGS